MQRLFDNKNQLNPSHDPLRILQKSEARTMRQAIRKKVEENMESMHVVGQKNYQL